ncbi:MAG TPA: hydrogenase [Lentisphaeria bacterium]|nr:MAG: hypothetical protein A2X48_19865 [Lentisphaerae bacterium GWF2_49_21]HBC86955.1 hydrogenase [Lentisphaeria bacterium]
MNIADSIMILLLLTNLGLLASSRLNACIKTVAIQGLIVGLLPLVATKGPLTIYSFLLALLIITVKGIVFPYLLKYTLRSVDVRREIEPFIGYGASIIIGIVALICSFWLSMHIPFPDKILSATAPAVAFFTIFCGLFLIVSRVKALTQVMGYIVFENGIYIFGSALFIEQSFLVELGIILDVFVVVFIMGIMMFHISRAFDHIDTDKLGEK